MLGRAGPTMLDGDSRGHRPARARGKAAIMSLSEREQQVLDDIGLHFAADDPRLARRLRCCGRRRHRFALLVVVYLLVGAGAYAAGCCLSGGLGTVALVVGYCLVAAALASLLPRL